MLTVLRRIGTRCSSPLWRCKCRCGTEHSTTSGALLGKGSNSCGCLRAKRFELREKRLSKITNRGRGTGICIRCGKPTRAKRHRFCSRKCYAYDRQIRCLLRCSQCGKRIVRVTSTVKESNYCSRSCHLKSRHSVKGYEFGYYLNCLLKRTRKSCSLTLADVKDQWEKQAGICPYTGWHLDLATWRRKRNKSPKQASIDRIDNSIGYEKGNIQFVALIVNYAKNTFTDDDLVEMCKAVAKRRTTKYL